MSDPASQALFERAKKVIPGGVNSPVRAFRAVGGSPVFIQRAKGATLVGADGKEYIDFVSSWGPMVLGHAHPQVIAAVQAAAELGTSFGAPTGGEVEMAELISELVPSMEMSRLTSSGTEAVMGALRVARGFTGKPLVVKCAGNYHGGADYLLVKAGSGLATFGVPDSAGVPESIAKTTTIIPYNDSAAAEALFAERGAEVAAVILEPVAGNMGCVPADPAWLATLRRLTEESGALLVFDEVMTGFRVALGGAQALYEMRPDLTCLGKIVGGGLPVGAYGGRRDIMETVSPVGPVYQAGTLSGNPLAVAAGMTTLRLLQEDGVYDRLEAAGKRVAEILEQGAKGSPQPVTVQRVGSMVTPFFHDGPVRSWDDAAKCNTETFGRFHQALIAEGVHWPAAQYEAGFVSLAHDDAVLDRTEAAVTKAFSSLA
ncbi:MAG: glutamate-1-semialdehyde 2,1-aminomutase [Myxococcota bacterium]